MKKKILSFMAVMIVLTANYVLAEEEKGSGVKYNLGNIIVSATKTESYQAEVGNSTTVITSQDIERTGKRTVQEVLRDVPGVAVMQSGTFGGTTSIYLRGAKPGQTLVLIDGIEVNDPMSTDRSFDFAHLTTDNIERIEVVAGPQSPLYGSDAMTGVVNIITKKGKGKQKFNSSFEGGSHNTFRENFGVSGGTEKLNYSLSASRLDSDGINKADSGTENDGYENTAISSKIGYKIFDSSELSLVTRFTDAQTDIDDGASDDDPNYIAWWRDFATKLTFDQSINSWWAHTLSFSYHDVRRKYRDDKDASEPLDYVNSWYKGDNKKIEWQHSFSAVSWDTLTAGFEYEQERGSSYYYSESAWGPYASKFNRETVDTKGYYLQNQFKLWEKLFITPGLRIDDHELFGAETTYKISTAYLIPQTGTRLKGNWGTGFKAPSLYQLYSSYGSPSLKPDESKSYDFGFEQGFFKDKVSFDLTRFHNDFRNMVDWDSATSKYKNIGRAETKGFEIGAKFLPGENFTIGTNFTYTDTKDKETGMELQRRPKRQANFDVNWRFLEKANLNLGVTHVGSRKDTGYTTSKGYTMLGLACLYDITDNLHFFTRIENLFDKKYQEVRGFAAEGRSFYAGAKASF
ncbi:MAG: hypothetical protein A2047_05050 [Omnitrophica bacterium GWA2_41_15]|nr:MAG: hypothetical protein A2047_05050 [Omnitrophica bacterium GWA2_41_15]HAZ09802.1 TonB-dependent receptor [Candidatus Omnitrophota bacterium]